MGFSLFFWVPRFGRSFFRPVDLGFWETLIFESFESGKSPHQVFDMGDFRSFFRTEFHGSCVEIEIWSPPISGVERWKFSLIFPGFSTFENMGLGGLFVQNGLVLLEKNKFHFFQSHSDVESDDGRHVSAYHLHSLPCDVSRCPKNCMAILGTIALGGCPPGGVFESRSM